LVSASWIEVLSCGTMTAGPRLDPDLIFEDVFREMPRHLAKQRDEMLRALVDPRATMTPEG
jgi:hypothetical protein